MPRATAAELTTSKSVIIAGTVRNLIIFASRRDMKRGYLGLMVHQPEVPAGYSSAPASIPFLDIPVSLAMRRAIDSITADT
jgi:hypothetical protein